MCIIFKKITKIFKNLGKIRFVFELRKNNEKLRNFTYNAIFVIHFKEKLRKIYDNFC